MHSDPLIRHQVWHRRARTALGTVLLAAGACGLAALLQALWATPSATTRRVVWAPEAAPTLAVAELPSVGPLRQPPLPRLEPPEPQPSDPEQLLDELFELLEEARALGGPCRGPAPELSWAPDLDDAAQAQVDWMRSADDWAHVTPGNPAGATPSERAEAAGYPGLITGEILAWGQHTPRAAIRWWLHSPPHCRALLDPQAVDAGVALTEDPWTEGYVWAVVFGG
ncbi:MAG TPA: CAP domain-containing protein [Deltaproteobacteria bacterium]|nr:CAP domain-containing protein [Deltaproteobacteria bacterium]